jgi:phosphate transport system permease protein
MIKEDRELREGETAPIIFLVSSTANLHLQSFTTPVTGTPELIYAFAFSGYSKSNDVPWGRLQR